MVVAMTVLVGLATVGLIVYALCGANEAWELEGGVGRLARLKKRRDRVLRTMKDLETEREAEVLTQDEFRDLRARYKRRAIALSRAKPSPTSVLLTETAGGLSGVSPPGPSGTCRMRMGTFTTAVTRY